MLQAMGSWPLSTVIHDSVVRLSLPNTDRIRVFLNHALTVWAGSIVKVLFLPRCTRPHGMIAGSVDPHTPEEREHRLLILGYLTTRRVNQTGNSGIWLVCSAQDQAQAPLRISIRLVSDIQAETHLIITSRLCQEIRVYVNYGLGKGGIALGPTPRTSPGPGEASTRQPVSPSQRRHSHTRNTHSHSV
jgi:hypothetical protein